MRALKIRLAVSSRHGSTWESGEAVAEVLRGSGFQVDLADPEDVEGVEGYDAVVLGSSVYVGRWAAGARAMAERFAPALSAMPLWLFSSGPVGNPPAPSEEIEEAADLGRRLGARTHTTFTGRLSRPALSLAERAVVSLLHVPYGDFRDWAAIERWAASVAAELHGEEIRRVPLAR